MPCGLSRRSKVRALKLGDLVDDLLESLVNRLQGLLVALVGGAGARTHRFEPLFEGDELGRGALGWGRLGKLGVGLKQAIGHTARRILGDLTRRAAALFEALEELADRAFEGGDMSEPMLGLAQPLGNRTDLTLEGVGGAGILAMNHGLGKPLI